MSSLSSQDRASLCRFTFSDGRRCRSPRSGNRSHLCPYHARKEAQSKAADKLSRDISYFLSGDYLTACDLGTALGRLLPAVIRGDVKPRTAHTVAYLAQTFAQTIHLAQHEYINSFGTDGWRRTVRNSVNQNSEYRNPSSSDEPPQSLDPPQPPHPQPQPNHANVGAGLRPGSPTPTSAPPLTSDSPESPTSPPVSPRPRLRATTHLESTHTQSPTTVDSKPLTNKLNPLVATLRKNRGEGQEALGQTPVTSH